MIKEQKNKTSYKTYGITPNLPSFVFWKSVIFISAATRKMTNKQYSVRQIEVHISNVLTDSPRAPGGPLHKVNLKLIML